MYLDLTLPLYFYLYWADIMMNESESVIEIIKDRERIRGKGREIIKIKARERKEGSYKEIKRERGRERERKRERKKERYRKKMEKNK